MTIETLVADINNLINNDIEEYVNDNDFGDEFEQLYRTRLLNNREDGRVGTALRMSGIGAPCVRKVWYRNWFPSDAERVNSSGRLKFLFGDFLEVLLLRLAKDAGHDVAGEQDEMAVYGVNGHRDAVIDGVTIDCKSASSFSFRKFAEGLDCGSDSFGYLTQLEMYVRAGKDDPIVTDKTRGGFLVIDKQFGHICLDLHDFGEDESKLEQYVADRTAVVSDPDRVPPKPYTSVPDGKSGNQKLDTVCSYCEFKNKCWPTLRTFIYSTGPKYLTQVNRTPNVPEAK